MVQIMHMILLACPFSDMAGVSSLEPAIRVLHLLGNIWGISFVLPPLKHMITGQKGT